jgi:RimJ/RimL family protein N-acetyltransferase
MGIRKLVPGDEERLQAFLSGHVSSSLFLLSNLRAAGLVDGGKPFEGTYAAGFREGEICGVVAHYWNGNFVLQAPSGGAVDLARFAAAQSGRDVHGVIGPWEQVESVVAGLGLAGAATHVASCEDLFSLHLEALQVPWALAAGEVRCRLAMASELSLLSRWKHDFRVEALGEPAGEALLASAREEIGRAAASNSLFVLEADGRLVSMCAFTARVPACVQFGGVWTPSEHRGRGHARAVVAGALLSARREGTTTSVLFTGRENEAARRAYEALGYRRVGSYGLVLFRDAHPLKTAGP